MIIEVGSLRFLCERFNVGVVSKVGNRLQNEDSYIVTHDLGLDTCLKSSFYAIIDGHGGEHCSQFLQRELSSELRYEFSVSDIDPPIPFSYYIQGVFERVYARLDKRFLEEYPQVSQQTGAVIVGCLIIGTEIFCINLGDCRAVLCR